MVTTVAEELGVPRPLHLLLLILIRSIVGGRVRGSTGDDTTRPSDHLITVRSLHVVAVVGVDRLVLRSHHLDVARDEIAGLSRLVVLLLLLELLCLNLAVDNRSGVIWQMLMRLLIT